MTITLPNPFQFESAPHSSRAGQLTAHVDHAAVLLSRAKATEGKAGMAGATGTVRRSTAGTGLRVGVASAVLPATSEVMDVTAGETALNSRDGASERPAQMGSPAVTARRDEQPFFSYVPPSSTRSARLVALPSDVVAELEAGIAAIVALVAGASAPLFLRDPSPEYLEASSNHIALRSFDSNSITSFSKA